MSDSNRRWGRNTKNGRRVSNHYWESQHEEILCKNSYLKTYLINRRRICNFIALIWGHKTFCSPKSKPEKKTILTLPQKRPFWHYSSQPRRGLWTASHVKTSSTAIKNGSFPGIVFSPKNLLWSSDQTYLYGFWIKGFFWKSFSLPLGHTSYIHFYLYFSTYTYIYFNSMWRVVTYLTVQ